MLTDVVPSKSLIATAEVMTKIRRAEQLGLRASDAGSTIADEIVVDMAREVLPMVKRTPVLAGVNGTDPFMLRTHFLRQLIDMGFSGVQNFPTVGLIDGTFRANLEETGMGYGLEVDMIADAASL